MSTAPATSPACAGSSSSASAIATEKSGAVPTTTEVRDGPASRIANVNRSWEIPGPRSPASANGHSSPGSRPCASANGSVTSSATRIVSSVPASASPPRAIATLSATVMAPKSAAEQTARRTASTARGRYRRPQCQAPDTAGA